MNSFAAYCFIFIGMLAVDVCARFVIVKHKRPAGILAMLLMCTGVRVYKNKPLAVKRFILSLLLMIFLLLATSFMLKSGISREAGLLDFALLLAPLFIMPFYHFLYELWGIGPLLSSSVLVNFRLRGALSLLLSANIIFISLNPLNSLISVIGHFTLGYLAVLGMFYLCSLSRRKPTNLDAPTEDCDEALEPALMRYSLSVLEIFYYLGLLFFTFLSGLSQTLAISGHWFFAISTASLLLLTTVISKFQIKATSLLSFYENKAVPLSFMFFGLMQLLDAYF